MRVHEDRPPLYLVEVLLLLSLVLLLLLLLFLGDSRRARGLLLKKGDAAAQPMPEVVYDLTDQPRKATVGKELDPIDKLGTAQADSSARVLSARLFFVIFNEAGQLKPVGFLREVPVRSAPLTLTLESLLDGPDPREINLGIHTMIPEAAQLLNSSLRDGVAVLDFNEAFFKNIDVASVRWAQLRQVVFTATEFEGVSSVRFLQQGQLIDKWGTIELPRPLSRKDFF